MRPFSALPVAAALLLAATPACAQPLVSAGPDAVSVTVYRAPYRDPGESLDLERLEGYALIAEQRTLTIPAGRATIRFEGVAGGILPESAIVRGLPEGVREKNLDADLLRPWSLYARSLGRPVTIRHMVGDKLVEERAIIRSGPEGAAVLQTAQGFIVADCGGEDDQLVYESLPEGLTPRPTLSIETDSPAERRVTITLAYLAWGFDWQASYVATMRPDGRTADLFAWVTLANMDVTSFADAEAMVVAGKVAREDDPDAYLDAREKARDEDEFRFQCTSRYASAPELGAMSAPPEMAMNMPTAVARRMEADAAEIIVTGSRARLEALGDLKLYRLPVRTTVAANSQKQVAMIDQRAVPVDVIYRARIFGDDADGVKLLLRAHNRKEKGLGIPLPGGPVALFEPRGEAKLLIGEARLADKAVNEEVELEFAEATQVTAEVADAGSGDGWHDHELTVTNANPWPIRFEGDFDVYDDMRLQRPSARLGRKNGRDLWSAEVPANGTAKLRYRLRRTDRTPASRYPPRP